MSDGSPLLLNLDQTARFNPVVQVAPAIPDQAADLDPAGTMPRQVELLKIRSGNAEIRGGFGARQDVSGHVQVSVLVWRPAGRFAAGKSTEMTPSTAAIILTPMRG